MQEQYSMAKAKQTITTKVRRKKVPSGMVACNVCHGKGYHKKANHKKA